MGEEIKIKPVIEKYLTGSILDIGCGDSKITPEAYGIDGRNLPGVDFVVDGLYNLFIPLRHLENRFDCVFSSHCLEHLPDSFRAIKEWSFFCNNGGYFILYLPDGRYYNNYENPEHFHNTEYESFIFWFKQTFCGGAKNFKGEQYAKPIFELLESGMDIGENKYSFYLVAKKL